MYRGIPKFVTSDFFVLFTQQISNVIQGRWNRGMRGGHGHGEAYPPPLAQDLADNDRSVNTIPTKGADQAHRITTCPSDFQTFRRLWDMYDILRILIAILYKY